MFKYDIKKALYAIKFKAKFWHLLLYQLSKFILFIYYIILFILYYLINDDIYWNKTYINFEVM